MKVKGMSGVLILSLESGARIFVHVLSVIKQALCLYLGIKEGDRKQRGNAQGAYNTRMETSHDTEHQSSATCKWNSADERTQNSSAVLSV